MTPREEQPRCTAWMGISPGKELTCILPAGHEGSHQARGWTWMVAQEQEEEERD